MKKISIALATTAVAGLSVLSAGPALAVGLPFNNCSEAAAAGVYNIPVGTPGYQPGLNRDGDATGCDEPGTPPYDASIVDRIVAENTVTTPPVTTPTVPQQMGQMPVGGADTGVAQAPQGDDSAALALGGGLVLAVIGGAFVVRRRMATN
ncbi:excalibur calcium-binding domain-containing protein [Arthrobacter sp. CP30]